MGKNPVAKAAKVEADKAKSQRAQGQTYDKPSCPYCRALSRRKFEPGRGKNARLQHSRWRVCKNDHKFMYKRGQLG